MIGAIKLYCDLDGVLVNQTSRKRFDLMDWTADGKELWEFIKHYNPTILSQLMKDIYEVSAPEKLLWVDRELGGDVPAIVVRAEAGKGQHAKPGSILIDDSIKHQAPWIANGGVFIHHRSAKESIKWLRALLPT